VSWHRQSLRRSPLDTSLSPDIMPQAGQHGSHCHLLSAIRGHGRRGTGSAMRVVYNKLVRDQIPDIIAGAVRRG
jgi:hypothetical protein